MSFVARRINEGGRTNLSVEELEALVGTYVDLLPVNPGAVQLAFRPRWQPGLPFSTGSLRECKGRPVMVRVDRVEQVGGRHYLVVRVDHAQCGLYPCNEYRLDQNRFWL